MERAGVRRGDLIYDCWNRVVAPLREARVKPGDRLRFQIMRDLKDRLEITVTVGEFSPGKEGL